MDVYGYLDFHSHILPGVDDGSKSIEMTEQMLELAYAQGVRTMVATPHNYPGDKKQNNSQMKQLYKQVAELAKKQHPDMKILLGNEVFYRESMLEEIKEQHILTMGDSRYLLVEFSPHEHYARIYQGIKELIDAGYYPVIAHIERVHCLFDDEKNISELVEMGCYMQANCEDFMGGFLDRSAFKLRSLLQSGWIHFLGSDCHNITSRPPLMSDCIERLYKKMPKDVVNRVIYDNQKRFIEKKYI